MPSTLSDDDNDGERKKIAESSSDLPQTTNRTTGKRKKSIHNKKKKRMKMSNTNNPKDHSFEKSSSENHLFNDIKHIYEQMMKDFNEQNFNSLPKSREEEFGNIIQQIQRAIKKQCGKVIYVFGKEGTGKTHLMKYIVNQVVEGNDKLFGTIPFVDCSTRQVESLKELCKVLYMSYNKKESNSITPSKLFTKSKKMRLIILDSADCLIVEKVKDQLKKWAESFNCIFICITTNQIVSHDNLVIFRPFSSADLTVILSEKLKTFLERKEKPTFDRNLIGIISKHFEEFDLRHVFKLVNNVISLCMEKNSNQVNIPTFFQIASIDLASRSPVSIIGSLSFPQQRLLEVLTRKQSIIHNIEQQIQLKKMMESSDSEEIVLKHQEDISSLVFFETVSLDHVVRIFNEYMHDFTNEKISYLEVKEMCRVLDDLKLLKLDQMKLEETNNSHVIISNNIKANSTIDVVTVLVSFETVQEGMAKKKEKTQSDISLK